jgi:hypothetical protein
MKQLKIQIILLVLFLSISLCLPKEKVNIKTLKILKTFQTQERLVKNEKTKSCLINLIGDILSKFKNKKNSRESRYLIKSYCTPHIQLYKLKKAIVSYYRLNKLLIDQKFNKNLKFIHYLPIKNSITKSRIVLKQSAIVSVLKELANVIFTCKKIPNDLKLLFKKKIDELKNYENNTNTKLYENQFSEGRKIVKLLKLQVYPKKYFVKRFSSLSKRKFTNICRTFKLFSTRYKCRDSSNLANFIVNFLNK